MQNPSIIETVKKVIDKVNPKDYLEISESHLGLRFIDMFQNTETHVIGVNHWPRWDLQSLPQNIIIFPVRSDYYWHSPYMTLNYTYQADVILIDGCQKVELALKNIVFASKYLNENGIILVTNTAPDDPTQAIRPKFGEVDVTRHGDTYRLLSVLKKANTGTIHQILCDDGGLCVLSNLNADVLNINMITYVRDCLNIPLEDREKSYDITLEEYLALLEQSKQNQINIS